MNDHIDNLFQATRTTEPDLPSREFVAGLNARIGASQHNPQSSSVINGRSLARPGLDWVMILTNLLVILALVLFTPLSFWIGALPHQPVDIQIGLALVFSGLLVAAGSLFLFDWEMP